MRAGALLLSFTFVGGASLVAVACSTSGDNACPAAAAADLAARDSGGPTDGNANADDATVAVGAEDAGATSTGQLGDASAADADFREPEDAAETPFPDSAIPPVRQVFLRVANWSSDAPGADFCIAPHGTNAFQGPLLSNLAAQSGLADGGAAAVTFPSVSAYSLVAPGAYDARVVVPGSQDCTVKVIPDAMNVVSVQLGQAATIALVGSRPAGGPPKLQMVGFLDDTATPLLVELRAINASPDLPLVDVGTVAASIFQPLFGPIPFPSAGGTLTAAPDGGKPGGKVSPTGYLSSPALTGATFEVAAAGTDNVSVLSMPTTIAPGAVVTLVVAGRQVLSRTDAGIPIAQLVECIDNAGTVGVSGSCSVISPKGGP